MALLEAIENGNLSAVRAELTDGVDPDSINEALYSAAHYGHVDTVKVLLANGADVAANDNEALRLAAAYGHVNTVKVLLVVGADVAARNNEALRLAAEKGHGEVVRILNLVED